MENLEDHPIRGATEPAMNLPSQSRFSRFFPDRLFTIILIAVFLAGWELAAHLRWVNALFFPAPSSIAESLLVQIRSGELLTNLCATLKRAGIGLLFGCSAGLAFGIVLGWSTRLRHLFDPIIGSLYPIPKLALFPLFLVIFGLGDSPRIVLIALASFFPMLINTIAGVRQINPEYYEIAQGYKANRRIILRRVVLPGALPSALSGLRLAVGVALITAIAVELMNAKDGLGAQIWWAWETLRTGDLYVAILATALLGIGSHYILEFLSHLLLPWQTYTDRQAPSNPIPEI
jgi:ABC-type nitrate/sulfonate/bicarbonate transport system permease component